MPQGASTSHLLGWEKERERGGGREREKERKREKKRKEGRDEKLARMWRNWKSCVLLVGMSNAAAAVKKHYDSSLKYKSRIII